MIQQCMKPPNTGARMQEEELCLCCMRGGVDRSRVSTRSSTTSAFFWSSPVTNTRSVALRIFIYISVFVALPCREGAGACACPPSRMHASNLNVSACICTKHVASGAREASIFSSSSRRHRPKLLFEDLRDDKTCPHA